MYTCSSDYRNQDQPVLGLTMRFIYAIKAVFYILLSGEDAILLVDRIYEWTDHKNTSWANSAARLLLRKK